MKRNRTVVSFSNLRTDESGMTWTYQDVFVDVAIRRMVQAIAYAPEFYDSLADQVWELQHTK